MRSGLEWYKTDVHMCNGAYSEPGHGSNRTRLHQTNRKAEADQSAVIVFPHAQTYYACRKHEMR